jgi:AcrR family transcriptional regulator
MDSDSPKRSYDNSLREQQAQATRERILDGMARDIADHGFEEFSIARVAKRAGVSEPTIYRHFGGREQLFEAFSDWFEARSSHPGYPKTFAELLETGIDGAFAYFDAHEPYIRAARASKLAEVFKPGRRRRQRLLAEVLATATERLDPAQAKPVVAVLGMLISSRTYLALKDDYGLSTEQAAAAVNWAVRALADQLERQRPDPEPNP